MAVATAGPRRITRAVLSAAGRRTALDSSMRPKALLDIEGASLISHVLRQLHRGGIVNVVLVVSYHGPATIEEVDRCCAAFPSLCVEIVDLGAEYQGFYAKSLLAARGFCHLDEAGDPGVLIATADHIFDETLVDDICRVQLEPERTEACVLVDFARGPFPGLPDTTVGVRCEESRVSELSRALGRPAVLGALGRPGVGVEAGLFACRGTLFDRLERLAGLREYFTLTDAVQELASAGLVASLATAGRRWVAVETMEELECVRGDSGRLEPGLLAQRSPQGSPCDSRRSPQGSPCDSRQDTPQYLREPVPVFFVAGSKEEHHKKRR